MASALVIGAGIGGLLVIPIIFDQTEVVVARPDNRHHLYQIRFPLVK